MNKDTLKKVTQGDREAAARVDPHIAALVTALAAVLVNFGPLIGLDIEADRVIDLGLAIGAVLTSARALQLSFRK